MYSIRFKVPAIVISAVAFLELLNFFFGPFGLPKGKTILDFLFLVVVLFHGLWVYRLLAGNRRRILIALFRTPEILFAVTGVLFLLAYIFGSHGGVVHLPQLSAVGAGRSHLSGPASARLNTLSRFIPLLAVQVWALVLFRLRAPRIAAFQIGSRYPAAKWGMGLAILSALLFAFSFPSFLSLEGWSMLAFIALVPLFSVFYRVPYGRGVFYGVTFGVVETLLSNYWLGSFRDLSLQFVSVLMLVEFGVFVAIALLLFRRLSRLSYLVFPVTWVAFDWLKSLGVLGYPWDMIGSTQYRFTSFIQIASLTGIWGVSFMVLAANAVFAYTIQGYLRRREATRALQHGAEEGGGPTAGASTGRDRPFRHFLAPLWIYVGASIAVFVFGNVEKIVQADEPVRSLVSVALIQQDTNPRAEHYAKSFAILERLTDRALFYRPDLVVWPEAAFVPNIRKWSKLNPKIYPRARLVHQFLAYDKTLGDWLITGNDDYTRTPGSRHATVRREYDASVLFSAVGRRVQTYHEIRIVPYTEYYSSREGLPFLYRLLPSLDMNLRQAGEKYVVFKTPKLRFSTPLGFEDAFPNDVRHFVRGGAQVIISLSNDYRSRNSVEGQQHYMNALFRAVENRRPLLRASSSGLTAYIDTAGRLIAAAPYYKQAYLVITLPLKKEHETLYTRIGDWFPKLCILIYLILLFPAFSRRRRGRPATIEHPAEHAAV